MNTESLTVALITDVFPTRGDEERLLDHLREARARGAKLAVLPELPLNRWAPLSKVPSDADAEPPYGPRESAMAVAARATGLAVLGGAIVRDPGKGRRHNTAVLFDATGEELLRYRKIHLPDEEGYWEAHHYRAGGELQAPVDVGGFGIGVQVCSDANRPQGCNALAAMGADAILLPRATPAETYPRWRLVLRANAVTSCAYVISVNRPGTRSQGVVGGPSMVADPAGDVLKPRIRWRPSRWKRRSWSAPARSIRDTLTCGPRSTSARGGRHGRPPTDPIPPFHRPAVETSFRLVRQRSASTSGNEALSYGGDASRAQCGCPAGVLTLLRWKRGPHV